MPLYVVKMRDETRLVEAKTRDGARAYVSHDTITVEVATPAMTHRLAAAGIAIESALAHDGQSRIE